MSISEKEKMTVASYSETQGGQESIPTLKYYVESIALDEYVLKMGLEVFKLEKKVGFRKKIKTVFFFTKKKYYIDPSLTYPFKDGFS